MSFKKIFYKIKEFAGIIALLLVLSVIVMASGQASNFARIVLGTANYGTDPNTTADITFQNDEYISNATDGTLDFGAALFTTTGTYDATISTAVAGGETGVYSYISQATTALTGELIGVRGNSRSNVASPSGTIMGGKFQAGNMSAGYNASTVTGVYVDVVNKIPPDGGDSTVVWTNARGYEVSMDLNQGSANKTNTVTNAYMFYGVYNLPTVGTYATVTNGYGVFLRNEAVGGTGQALDAAVYIDDRSMSGGIHGWDYGIDMSGVSGFTYADIKTSSGAKIFTGSAANGDAVYAEVGAYDATGSIYLSTAAGAIYIQVANNGAAADWYKVTMSDAD